MLLTERDEELHNEILREEGMEDAKAIFKLHISGKSDEGISKVTGISLERVKKVLY